jgi:hypothetical protein
VFKAPLSIASIYPKEWFRNKPNMLLFNDEYIYIYIYSNFCSRNETLCSAGVYSCAQNRSYHLHIYIYINKERERRSVRCREREGKREKTSSHHLIVLFVYYFEIIYLLLSKRTSNKNLPVLLSLSGSYI